MNVRRFSLAAVFVLAVAVAAALGQPPVTVVLTNGQQYNGSLVGVTAGSIVVDLDGRQRTFSRSQVGVVEFNGEQPTPQELLQVSNTAGSGSSFLRNIVNNRNAVLVLQDGSMVTGTLASVSDDGNQITLSTQNGQRTYLASDIARLYPSPSNARSLQNMTASDENNPNQYYGYGTPVGTSGQTTGSRSVTVPANQPWTRTGVFVRQGERLAFQVSGEIHYSGDPKSAVGPKGGGIGQDVAESYPIPTAGVGALIARVGSSEPFLIGDFSQPLSMPASGELYLGINDNIYNDNTGNFTVKITRASGR